MKTIIAQAAFVCHDSNIRLVEETLSDNSVVFNIEIGRGFSCFEIPCADKKEADLRYSLLLRCISPEKDYPGELQLAMDTILYVGGAK